MSLVSEQDYDAVVETFITHLANVPTGPDLPIMASYEGHPPANWNDQFPALTVIDTDAIPISGRSNEVWVPQIMAFEVRVQYPAIYSGGEQDARLEAQTQTRRAMSYWLKYINSYESRIYGGYTFTVERLQSGMFDHLGNPAGVDTASGSLLWVRLATVRADQFGA